MDVSDTPKRSKSSKSSKSPLSKPPQSGVDALLNPPLNTKELALMNVVNGDSVKGDKELDAPTALDIEPSTGEFGKHKKSKRHSKSKEAQVQRALLRNADVWRVSESIGGRMINADPVFTEDEKYAKSSTTQRMLLMIPDFSFLPIAQRSTYTRLRILFSHAP